MPGFELIGKEELEEISSIFKKSNGVLFAHGFDQRRNNIYKVREFEHAVANHLGVKYCQAVSSGSAALLVALKALGVGPGDEVITSSFTFVATAEAIIEVGAIPVFTEINETFNMDPEDLKKKITNRTKVVIPVHMAGAVADMVPILEIAQKYSLKVLEDSAQNFGTRLKGESVGCLGDMGIYSLDFAKTITTGEGGLIVTNDKNLFEKARAFHDHGHEYNPNYGRALDTRSSWGFNYRMSELQAAVGIAQLKKIEYILAKQRENKNRIKNSLSSEFDVKYRLLIDNNADGADTIIIIMDSEEKALFFTRKLNELGYWTKNLPDAITWHFAGTWDHMLNHFAHINPCSNKWGYTNTLIRKSIALPVSVSMTEEDLNLYIKAIKGALNSV